MRYGSVCSGIEAATVAWHPLGWTPAFFSEIDAFPSAVLAHRFPGIPNHGDFTTIPAEAGPIDVLVGGTPCQSFSVAGLRGGMADARGNLALEFLRLAGRLRPEWVVWENVPGVLSSGGGRDFGSFLGGLVELGYGFAYRVLDAQHFGVPQRRRRVFVVGHSGGLWYRAAAVLFERSCLSGDPPPGREAGARVARCLVSGPNGSQRNDGTVETFVAHVPDVAFAVKTQNRRIGQGWNDTMVAHSLRADGFDASEGRTVVAIDLRQASRGEKDTNNRTHGSGGPPGVGVGETGGPAFSVTERGQAVIGQGVRRLTPRECERLQGFPDDYTLIPCRDKPAADGPRYKALGNSMAVPVMAWIGRRIEMVREVAG